jgi:hypothetical protein
VTSNNRRRPKHGPGRVKRQARAKRIMLTLAAVLAVTVIGFGAEQVTAQGLGQFLVRQGGVGATPSTKQCGDLNACNDPPGLAPAEPELAVSARHLKTHRRAVRSSRHRALRPGPGVSPAATGTTPSAPSVSPEPIAAGSATVPPSPLIATAPVDTVAPVPPAPTPARVTAPVPKVVVPPVPTTTTKLLTPVTPTAPLTPAVSVPSANTDTLVPQATSVTGSTTNVTPALCEGTVSTPSSSYTGVHKPGYRSSSRRRQSSDCHRSTGSGPGTTADTQTANPYFSWPAYVLMQ